MDGCLEHLQSIGVVCVLSWKHSQYNPQTDIFLMFHVKVARDRLDTRRFTSWLFTCNFHTYMQLWAPYSSSGLHFFTYWGFGLLLLFPHLLVFVLCHFLFSTLHSNTMFAADHFLLKKLLLCSVLQLLCYKRYIQLLTEMTEDLLFSRLWFVPLCCCTNLHRIVRCIYSYWCFITVVIQC